MHRSDFQILAEWVCTQPDQVADSLAETLDENYSNFNKERWQAYVAKAQRRNSAHA